MKLFVYEHITSGALAGQELPHSLAKEGDLMLLAILQDLAVQPQIELIILRDSRLPKISSLSDSSSYEVLWVQANKHFDQQWDNALSLADMSFIIAPETDRQLENIQQNVLNSGKSYLGSSQAATQLCADKLQCFAHLTNSNISTVKTQLASEWLATKQGSSDAVIIKPIDGAGCLNTLLFESSLKAQNYLQNTPALVLSSLIVQAYIKGTAASLCLFISDETVTVLSINRQLISQKQSQLVFVASENTLQLTNSHETRRKNLRMKSIKLFLVYGVLLALISS